MAEATVETVRNYQVEIRAGQHRLTADEPVTVGARLREIASKCPVHRTLTSEIVIREEE